LPSDSNVLFLGVLDSTYTKLGHLVCFTLNLWQVMTTLRFACQGLLCVSLVSSIGLAGHFGGEGGGAGEEGGKEGGGDVRRKGLGFVADYYTQV
jgi:hypothetical protein